jgi:hypothetical protein
VVFQRLLCLTEILDFRCGLGPRSHFWEGGPALPITGNAGGSTLFPVQQVTAARAALAALALEYESVAFASTVEEPSLGAVLRKERRQRQ